MTIELTGAQQWLILREVKAGTTMPVIAELLSLHHRTLQRRVAADPDLCAMVRQHQAAVWRRRQSRPYNAQLQRTRRLERAARFAAGEYPNEQHGTYRAYMWFSCRCGRCRAAGSARNRRNRLQHGRSVGQRGAA